MHKVEETVKIEMAKTLVNSLKNAKSEKDQLKAAKAIAKYIGMMNKAFLHIYKRRP